MPTYLNELASVIRSLNYKFSAGLDEVPSFILKRAYGHFLSHLCHITDESFTSGVFPDKLKTSIVKPSIKKGDHHDCFNYRLITLVSTISKIIEKIVMKRLVHLFTSKNIICKEQYGFQEEWPL